MKHRREKEWFALWTPHIFVLAAFLGFLWSVARIFIQAPSGRQRFNVLGALNAITHEMITITNDAYINAECVCALLEKLAVAM